MTFEEKFEQYLQRITRFKDQFEEMTEEATKNALVMPFFSMLGYDVFDTNEFMPEFTCDVAAKKGEKIDYAILKDGEPTMLIECKKAGMKLQKQQQAQLFRYFSTNRCRIAILTNGVTYQFFSDLNAPNVMDDDPFLSFNLLEDDPTIYRSAVRQFQRDKFDVKHVISKAVFQKYSKVVEKTMREDLENPSDALVKYFLSRPEVVTGSRITSQMIEKYREVTKAALLKVFANACTCELTEAEEIPTVRKPARPKVQEIPEEPVEEAVTEPITEEPETQPVEETAPPVEEVPSAPAEKPIAEEPIEEVPSVRTFASAEEICNYLTERIAEVTCGASCVKEDGADFIRLHIYNTTKQKLAVLKIMKSDLSMQLRKFTNGVPSVHPANTVEDVMEILQA